MDRLMRELVNETKEEDIADRYRPIVQIRNILKDEPIIGQMSIFDMENEQKST